MQLTGRITTKGGLLYQAGHVIQLPMADFVARDHGFQHAEQLVKFLEKNMKTSEPFMTDITYLRYLNRAIGQLPMGPERDAIERQFLAALIKIRSCERS